jgi:hypothetical protein
MDPEKLFAEPRYLLEVAGVDDEQADGTWRLVVAEDGEIGRGHDGGRRLRRPPGVVAGDVRPRRRLDQPAGQLTLAAGERPEPHPHRTRSPGAAAESLESGFRSRATPSPG